MPFIPAPGIIQANAVWLLFGQRVENVWEFDVGEPPPVGALQSIANMVRDWTIATHAPLVSNQATFLLVETKDMGASTGGVGVSAPTAPVSGGSAGASMPGGTALCVSLRTVLSGRSFRGRKYFFGLNRSQCVDNAVLTGYANDFAAAVNTLIATAAAASTPMSIVSRYENKVARSTAVVTHVQSAVLVDYNLDSQRRRLTGRGN